MARFKAHRYGDIFPLLEKIRMKHTIKKITSAFYRLLDIVMVLCMIIMVVLVFTNVVLRMGFNTGIDFAEELPRFAFVWMAFVGGIVGLHRRSHLGVDMLVAALPRLGKKVCWAISQAIMTVCGFYIFYGTWLQHDVIRDNSSPVMQISTLWIYGISYLTGFCIMIICSLNIIRLFMGLVEDYELIDVREEGLSEIEESKAGEKA